MRFVLWTLICSVSAVPSFWGALAIDLHERRHIIAMCLGILAWVILYTAATGTQAFRRRWARPRIRLTYRIVYGTRLVISVALPLGFFLDIWCGMVSVAVGQFLFEDHDSALFVGVTTVVQGGVLNVALLIYMGLLLGVQRLVGGPERPVHELACIRCGYDLRATGAGACCPECGLEVAEDHVPLAGTADAAETEAAESAPGAERAL